jgi:type VI protein secretion system component Hcp
MAHEIKLEFGGVKCDVINFNIDAENKTGEKKSTTMGNMVILKFVDDTSPALLTALLQGKAKKDKMTITIGSKPYVKYELTDAWISKIEIGGSNKETKFAESLSVCFAKMDFTAEGKTANYISADHSPDDQTKLKV